ncbi:hypothetical protein ACIBJD_13395 [Kitasatospora sp. NPDC050467]|uniref:hypothetical protein n=1 Tax=Kitasatospora sp. NPDC050467 TaxID=3364053 RepID=UPI00379D4A75
MPDQQPGRIFETAREFARRDDWDNAVVWYRRAADAGVTDAMLILAAHHAMRDEMRTAQDWLRRNLAADDDDREGVAGYLRGAIAAHFAKSPADARLWETRIRTSVGYPTPNDPLKVRQDAVAVVFGLLVEGIDPPGGPAHAGGSVSSTAGASGGCLLAVLAVGFLPALFAVLLAVRGGA